MDPPPLSHHVHVAGVHRGGGAGVVVWWQSLRGPRGTLSSKGLGLPRLRWRTPASSAHAAGAAWRSHVRLLHLRHVPSGARGLPRRVVGRGVCRGELWRGHGGGSPRWRRRQVEPWQHAQARLHAQKLAAKEVVLRHQRFRLVFVLHVAFELPDELVHLARRHVVGLVVHCIPRATRPTRLPVRIPAPALRQAGDGRAGRDLVEVAVRAVH